LILDDAFVRLDVPSWTVVLSVKAGSSVSKYSTSHGSFGSCQFFLLPNRFIQSHSVSNQFSSGLYSFKVVLACTFCKPFSQSDTWR